MIRNSEFTMTAAKVSHEILRLSNRLANQIKFARGLMTLHPGKAKTWDRLIKEVESAMTAAMATGTQAVIARAVEEAETTLAPIGKVAKTYTIHCVGHAHIDMNWQWSWPETVAVTHDTFSTVLRLMEEFPEFTFSQSQASVYRILEELAPEMLARIAQRVKEGRWEVSASHWVEGDKNMAGGEALCRHILYTRQYMKTLFGLTPEDVAIDFSPDTFGHAASIPTYLVRGAVKYYYLHRPGVQTPVKPMAFWWQGPDGSRVLVRNDMDLGYNNRPDSWIADHLLKFVREVGGNSDLIVYGIGDHGGGPTRYDVAKILEMDSWPLYPNVKCSTLRAFYTGLERDATRLKVIRGELNMEFTGCYTTQSQIKRANRFGETRLADAEIAAIVAGCVAAKPYPGAALKEGWRDTLFSHFHDILPGSGVHDTRTYTHGLFQKTMAATGMIETQSLRALAARVDTRSSEKPGFSERAPGFSPNALGAGVGFGTGVGGLSGAEQTTGSGSRPMMIFNPTAHAREEVVTATIWDNTRSQAGQELKSRSFVVSGPDGRTRAAQTLSNGHYWGHDYLMIAFPVSVPGLGYSVYTVTEAGGQEAEAPTQVVSQLKPEHHCAYAADEQRHEGLDNGLIRLELDPSTGGIRRLLDHRRKRALIDQPAAAPVLEYLIERSKVMTAWSMADGLIQPAPVLVSLKRKGVGPYQAALEACYSVAESEMTVTYAVKAGDPRVYIGIQGTWFQRGSAKVGVPTLRLALPLALNDARGRYEIPFGSIDRTMNCGEEVPALQWVHVTGKAGKNGAGLLLANDSKHGHSLDGNVLRLTLIRSSFDPDPLPEIGQHEIYLTLQPTGVDLSVAQAIAVGNDLNHPLRVVGTDVHQGALPVRAQLAAIGPDNIVLSGMKQAEEAGDLIVRLCETAGRTTTASIRLDSRLAGKVVGAVEVDLMERDVRNGSAKARGQAVSVRIPAHGISTVRIRIKR